MNWADCINIFLSASVLILTFAMFKLNKTMTKIAEDDKKEKTGHDLNIVLPTMFLDTSKKQCNISNFCIINNKNKVELIFRIYMMIEDKEYPFWTALEEPIILSPYEMVKVKRNTQSEEVKNLLNAKIHAVTNDKTVELDKNINCYNKPLEIKEN